MKLSTRMYRPKLDAPPPGRQARRMTQPITAYRHQSRPGRHRLTAPDYDCANSQTGRELRSPRRGHFIIQHKKGTHQEPRYITAFDMDASS